MQRLVLICAGLAAICAVSRVALKKKRAERAGAGNKVNCGNGGNCGNCAPCGGSTVEPTFTADEPELAKKPVNRGMRAVGLILALLLFCTAAVLGGTALVRVGSDAGEITGPVEAEFVRANTAEEEGYDEDNTVCRVEYTSDTTDAVLAVEYSYEEWEALPEGHRLTGYVYHSEKKNADVAFAAVSDDATVRAGLREVMTDREAMRLNVALALLLVSVGTVIMSCGWQFYSAYEKIWFLSILVLAAVFGILFPEEDCNGISGIAIMALYLLDTLLNIWCELLISKQSKWNFIVSVFVEIAEIGICVLLRYRFATMATTLFFWLPIDIISFVNWHRHPDRREEELTVVRTLRGWQEALVLVGIAVWTFGLGYLLTRLDVGTDLFGGNEILATLVIYLDACASAVGVANGLFILFRFREQWIAWITCAILEAVINVLSGQFVLLVLKAGYVTNSIYGYVKWTKYIKGAEEAKECAKGCAKGNF